MDYFNRWTKPGDELQTNVPARTEDYSNYRARTYSESAALITKGDYIRLQDIDLSYTFKARSLERLGLQTLRIFAYARNLGLIWKANKNGLDPEYPNADYPAPRSIAIGVQLDL